MNEEIFDVYITKFALTSGIMKRRAKMSNVSGMIEIVDQRYEYYHKEGRDWHKTLESAQKKAIDMKMKKINSLEKQLQKIKNMTFDEVS